MTRFLCVGDLHLDKGGRYGRLPGERLAEQETVWARILELAREHHVDAVLFAGDAFEKRHPSTDALLAFERPLVEHQRARGCRVIAIPGNHDRSGVSDFCALDVFAEAGLIALRSRPDCSLLTADGPAIACLPWAPVSRIVAAYDGALDRDDVNVLAAELLVESARELRTCVSGPAVLLTHFSLSGAALPGGVLTDQLREPVLPIEALEALGFDAIVAGHIHKAQPLGSLAPDDELMPIFYTGSPMPLDFGEGGYPHGVWLLEQNVSSWNTTFLPIESRRFVTLDESLTEHGTQQSLEDAVGASVRRGDYVKARIRATEAEARTLDVQALRDVLFEDGAHNVWVELDVQRELRARVAGVDETVTETEALELWMTSQGVNGDQAPQLRARHSGYLTQVGS